MTAKVSIEFGSDRACSFAPILGPNPRVLILGSLPGRASLAAGQYYAHPRNLFWRFLSEILGFSADLPYQERCQSLIAHGIAVWDVYAAATRAGSLDSAIQATDAQLNNLADLFRSHPTLVQVCCNGALAHQQFTHAWRQSISPQMRLIALPSTSPANASQSIGEKLARWRLALGATDCTL